jgi:hypothetical protein
MAVRFAAAMVWITSDAIAIIAGVHVHPSTRRSSEHHGSRGEAILPAR